MPKGYILAEVQVTDPAMFEAYRPLAAAAIAAFGGKYLVRGGATETLEGGAHGAAGVFESGTGDGLVQVGAVPGGAGDSAEGGDDGGLPARRA